jgi:hypothetical protein
MSTYAACKKDCRAQYIFRPFSLQETYLLMNTSISLNKLVRSVGAKYFNYLFVLYEGILNQLHDYHVCSLVSVFVLDCAEMYEK